MLHTNYFEIVAPTHYDAGLEQGRLFGRLLRDSVETLKHEGPWTEAVRRAQPYLAASRHRFPELIEEFEGCAEGAELPLDDLWVLNAEDELFGDELFGNDGDHCTTVITNDASLVAHNEDWSEDDRDAICVLRRTVGDFSTLELFYWSTLGGNAICVNSHGYVQSINTLTHTDRQIGVPRNLVARWLSETDSPERDFKQLCKIPRSSGYNHNLVAADGQVWNIECSAKRQKLTRARTPFVHTNHFLTRLRRLEGNDEPETHARFDYAAANVESHMSVDMLQALMSTPPVLNEATIARMIVDQKRQVASIWLLREATKGWVEYALP